MSARTKAMVALAVLLRICGWSLMLVALFCGVFMCSPANVSDAKALLVIFLVAAPIGFVLLYVANRISKN